MLEVPPPDQHYFWNNLSLNQPAIGKMVLGNISYGFGQSSISALRLSKQIEVSWITAHRMLRKIRMAMMHRDSIYRLENFVELDDAYVGGKKPGKRGRGAAGKKPTLVAVEKNGERAGFMAARVVEKITKDTVRDFLNRHMKPGQ